MAKMNYSNWEEYEGLPSDQEEEFYNIFFNYINANSMDYNTAFNHFQPGTDTLVEFLTLLENETEWFNYTQMDEIFQELSLYLIQLEEEFSDGEDGELE